MFYCGVPRNAAEFSRIWAVEQDIFGDLSVPTQVAREIYRQRPELFLAIFCRQSTVAAYTVGYPLQPRWAKALIAGDITEPELMPDMLLSHHDSHEGAQVYIGSVVIDEQHDTITRASLMAAMVSWRARQMREASIRRMSLLMSGVSKQGDKMIRYVNAKKLNSAENRKDGLAIYGRTITPGFLNRATTAIERCFNSRSVEMSLDMLPIIGSASSVPNPNLGYGLASAG
jgi:hypothetical protein